MAIARAPQLVIDCPDPLALATFYGLLLGWQVKDDGDWAEATGPEPHQMLNFQQVQGFRAPDWPGQDVPQQTHLDVFVDDLDAAETEVVKLGASKHPHQPGESYRVFLDPAGHTFCLCRA